MEDLYKKVTEEIPRKYIRNLSKDLLLFSVNQNLKDNILSAHNAGTDSAYILAFNDISEINDIKIRSIYTAILEDLSKLVKPFELETETFGNITALKVKWQNKRI